MEQKKIRAAITAIGHFVPDHVVPNSYFTDVLKLDTSDDWIRERTGIVERRWYLEGPTSGMGAIAARKALAERNMDPMDVECIIVATVTPDRMFPSTACIIQEAVGMKNAWGFDMEAACSGFLFALTTAARMIESGAIRNVLVIGADKMSSITNFTDRNSAILFGDAAAAVLLEPTTEEHGILDTQLYCDGSGEKFLHMVAGGSLNPASVDTVANNLHTVWQEGRAVFKVAVIGMADVSEEIMKRNNLRPEDIAWLIPHQANLRIIDACAERMGVDRSKVTINIDKYGNTTAATIPLCISEWRDAGKIKKGDNLILAAFGAGYSWGAVWVKWAI
jgi:3-oxoacyl-[acyl-carrier-protein] synthase-3